MPKRAHTLLASGIACLMLFACRLEKPLIQFDKPPIPPATEEGVADFPIIDDAKGEINRGLIKVRMLNASDEKSSPYFIITDRAEDMELTYRINGLSKTREGTVRIDPHTFIFELPPDTNHPFVSRFYVKSGEVFVTERGKTWGEFCDDKKDSYGYLCELASQHGLRIGGTKGKRPANWRDDPSASGPIRIMK